jgi:threonine/homoserine/homoserine lactone efflux protein
MGLDSLRFRGTHPAPDTRPSRSLLKGILANALNPHPYLFWLTVGAPLVTRALNHSLLAAVVFFAAFYTLLVGSKLLLAVVAARSRSFLFGTVYVTILRILGVALLLLAGVLVYDGLQLLGVL